MITFIWTGVACIMSGLFQNIYWICFAMFMQGFGFGGSLPIDGTLFLECIPPSKQSYLTLLSLWWPAGQVLTSLVAFLLLPSASCSAPGPIDCPFESNKGWRNVSFVIGGLVLLMCMFRYIFNLQESPKYLISRGRYQEAIDVLNYLAERNGKSLNLSVSDFETSDDALIKERNQSTWSRMRPLFEKELFWTTVILWLVWAFVNVGYNIFNGYLPSFLASAGNTPLSIADSYRNYVIISLVAVPGSVIGMFLTDMKIGRKGTMALATLLTGSSTFLFTVFNSNTGFLFSAQS